MIDTLNLAQAIADGLNALTDRFNFIVSLNEGKYRSTSLPCGRSENLQKINGILLLNQGDILPLKGLNNYYLPAALSLLVPKTCLQEVFAIVRQYVQENVGTAVNFGDYTAIVGFDMPSAGVLSPVGGASWSVPIHTNVYFNLFKNGISSNSAKISVDGEEMIYYNLNVTRTREGSRNNITNSEEMKTQIERQQLSFAFTIPYHDTPVIKKLMKDAFQGSIPQTYGLKYYDPIVEENVYEVVATEILPTFVAGKLAQITLRFELAQFAGENDNGG